MSAPTPGPWATSPARIGGDVAIVTTRDDGQRGFILAEAFEDIRRTGERAGEEAAANARLISAAPDLLSACEALVSEVAMQNPADPIDLHRRIGQLIPVVRLAIAKAGGK